MSDFELRGRITADAGDMLQANAQAEQSMRRVAQAGSQAGATVAEGANKATTAVGAEEAAMAKLRQEMVAMQTQATAMAARMAQLERQLQSAKQPMDALGVSAKQTREAFRQLPAQINDVIVSLISGQPAYLVAIQQGAQIQGAFGGFKETLAGLASVLTPARLLIGGLAGGVALGSVAAYQGSQALGELERSLILSGNASGTSADAMLSMANRIDGIVGTAGNAADALALMAREGNVSAGNLERFSVVAIEMERNVGTAMEDTAKAFAELGRDPLNATLRLNKGVNFLTESVFAQIAALMEQGRTVEAGRVAQEAYAQAMGQRMKEVEASLGTIPKLWREIKDGAKEAWDEMMGVGRAETLEDRLATAQKALADAQARAGSRRRGMRVLGADEEVASAQAAVDQVNSDIRRKAEAGVGAAAAALAADNFVKARTENQRYTEAALSNAERLDRALKRYRENNATLAAGGATLDPAQVAREEAAIRRQFEERRSGPSADTLARQLRQAQGQAELAAVQSQLQTINQAYSNAERELDSQRRAGLVADADYWAQKRALAQGGAQAELDALARENELLQSRRASGAEQVEINSRIARNREEMARIQARAATDLALTNAAEAAGVRQLGAAYQDFLRELERAQAARRNQLADSLPIEGVSSEQREAMRRRVQIEREFIERSQRLDDQRGTLGEDEYTRRLEALRQYHDDALAAEREHQAALAALEQERGDAMTRALDRFREARGTEAQQMENLYVDAFTNMENAIVQFVTTGKLNFDDLVESVVAGLIRIWLTEQLTSIFRTIFAPPGAADAGAGTAPPPGTQQAASGARVGAGQMVEVNEIGPELLSVGGRTYLMMGREGGEVSRNLDGRPAGGGALSGAQPTINVPITVVNATGSAVEAEQQRNDDGGITLVLRRIKADIASDVASGSGEISSALSRRYGLRPTMS